MAAEMKPPKYPSSHISTIGYDPETGALSVEFSKGGVYHYDGVDQQYYDALHESESPGAFFHAHIRSRFKPRKR